MVRGGTGGGGGMAGLTEFRVWGLGFFGLVVRVQGLGLRGVGVAEDVRLTLNPKP